MFKNRVLKSQSSYIGLVSHERSLLLFKYLTLQEKTLTYSGMWSEAEEKTWLEEKVFAGGLFLPLVNLLSIRRVLK